MANDQYFTIGELAEKTKLSRMTLFSYIKMGLIIPTIQTKTIRLYSPATIDRINKIQELKKEYHLSAIKNKLGD